MPDSAHIAQATIHNGGILTQRDFVLRQVSGHEGCIYRKCLLPALSQPSIRRPLLRLQRRRSQGFSKVIWQATCVRRVIAMKIRHWFVGRKHEEKAHMAGSGRRASPWRLNARTLKPKMKGLTLINLKVRYSTLRQDTAHLRSWWYWAELKTPLKEKSCACCRRGPCLKRNELLPSWME